MWHEVAGWRTSMCGRDGGTRKLSTLTGSLAMLIWGVDPCRWLPDGDVICQDKYIKDQKQKRVRIARTFDR